MVEIFCSVFIVSIAKADGTKQEHLKIHLWSTTKLACGWGKPGGKLKSYNWPRILEYPKLIVSFGKRDIW